MALTETGIHAHKPGHNVWIWECRPCRMATTDPLSVSRPARKYKRIRATGRTGE